MAEPRPAMTINFVEANESIQISRSEQLRREWPIAEGEQETGNVMVVFGRWRGAAGDPVEQIGVGAFEQRLVAVEPCLIEAGEVGFGKPAEQEVGLARAAMP